MAQIGIAFGIMDTTMRIGISSGNLIGGFISDQYGFFNAAATAGFIAIIPLCTTWLIRKNIKQT
ncbi:MAG: hypothetical protein QXX08_10955 [Candidatus Bathyarchaeia archaeon]